MKARGIVWIGLLAGLLAIAGCSESDSQDNSLDEPDADVGAPDVTEGDAGDDATVEEDAGQAQPFDNLRRPVTVITDDYGMKHIYAESLEDLFFMNGYVYAQDRFAQMEFYRRIATGTLSELVGGLSSDAVETDVLFRTLGLKRAAEAYVDENYDPDMEAYQVMDAYCAGINAYLEQYRQGEVSMPSVVEQVMPPSALRDWEPSDLLAVGKLLAVQLTYTAPMWIDAHAARQASLDTFAPDAADDALAARAGFLADVIRTAPATDTTHIDGFPTDGQQALKMPNQSRSTAPRIDRAILENALTLHEGLADIPGFEDVDLFGRKEIMQRGSNNWVLSGDLTSSGYPNVANDPHLGLTLPTIFYPIHLELENDIDGREPIKLVGAGILGLPGIVIGRTDKVAWGTTVGFYDYVDVYHETITGSSDDEQPATVAFGDEQVEVERVTETIKIGTFGNIADEAELVVEVVPHHGPILPPTADGRPVARTAEEGLSIKWVGLEANNEFRFLTNLWRAETPQDVEEALDFYTVGSSNFVFGFTSGETFYSGQSNIPVRQDGALNFDPVSNPSGNAPIFVLPSDGSAEWDGFVPEEKIPHAYNRSEGYVVTANNDQVGNTLDNNPFNDEYYLGGFYDLGFRAERITERLTNATGERPEGEKLTLDQQTDIQNDGFDKVAERVVPHMVAAIDRALDQSIDASDDPELQELRAEIAGRETELAQMRDLLASWDFESPGTREPSGEDVDRSAAAALFNTSMVYLIDDAFADEFTEIGFYRGGRFRLPSSSQILVRSLVYLLDNRESAQTYRESYGDSTVFDDMGTADTVETRQTLLVRAVLAGLDRLASGQILAEVFGREIPSPASANPADWVWGEMHGLRLDGLLPIPGGGFQRPTADRGLPFYERPGGQFAVTPCDHNYDDFNFTCSSGSSLRMLHDMNPDGPVTYNAVPGGYSGDPSSPFYDSEVEIWNRAEPRKLEDDRATLEANASSIDVYGE